MDFPTTISVSIGDCNGVGPEVVLKTFSDRSVLQSITPIVYAPLNLLQAVANACQVDVPIALVSTAEEAQAHRVNCIEVGKAQWQPGEVRMEAAELAFYSLEAATSDVLLGKTDALVTAPINKHNMPTTHFPFSGHTEFLAHRCGGQTPLMIMVAGGFRVAMATGHLPLGDVSEAITWDLLTTKLSLLHESLRKDFGIQSPRIAVLGLNPHAGDNGLLGKEEEEIISPVVQSSKAQGMDVSGPFSADGFFGVAMHLQYDGILAMYHDQGLAPFKALSFDEGVNCTAGLPIIRTSPDHGTAYDIAGSNKASSRSFLEAVMQAQHIVEARKNNWTDKSSLSQLAEVQ